ncbi:hypothetical protein EGW08_023456 [Elysia chlorotica]|uniref:Uncharacterized protein n=1 Tax=Elysia chlorotica TaxID=188477 RepID=A0A433SIM7_ELYCH|nr:hypothetical protein EGW08_023456 [Elysia chlorotica]
MHKQNKTLLSCYQPKALSLLTVKKSVLLQLNFDNCKYFTLNFFLLIVQIKANAIQRKKSLIFCVTKHLNIFLSFGSKDATLKFTYECVVDGIYISDIHTDL